MKKIKLLSTALTLLFLTSFVGTGMTAAASVNTIELDQTTFKVAIVYSTGGIDDKSFNQAAKVGIDAAKAQYGTDLTVVEVCTDDCDTIAKVTQQLIDVAEDATLDLIIGIGFSSADGINASALAHPDQNYMLIDAVVDLPNVSNIVFKEEEGSFLAGAMAAMVTQTEKLGFLGGLDIELINRFLAGYAHGAQYINENITIGWGYSPNPSNPWGDITGGKRIAKTFIKEGFDVVYAAAGGTGIGVIDGVAEENDAAGETKYYAIGVDSDQDHESPGDVLTSMVKRVDVAVKTEVDKLFNGTWSNGLSILGLAEGGVDISEMQYTTAIKDGIWEGTKTRGDVVADLKEAVINGTITVKSLKSEITGTEFDFKEEAADESFFPISYLPILFGMFIATFTAIRARRK